MTLAAFVRAVLAVCLVFALAGCEQLRNTPPVEALGNAVEALPGMGNISGLDIHAVRSIKTVIIHKIAVMPLIDAPDQVDRTVPSGAAESISAEVYARANELGGWTVVPQEDVDNAMGQLPPTTLANMDQNALALGRKVVADGVLYGTVHRYRERVGYDYAAQTPAAVAMTLHFADENSKQVVWTAKFAREQKALSDNILDLPNFLTQGGRWVRAHDIAAEGTTAALDNLQSKLTIQPIVQGK